MNTDFLTIVINFKDNFAHFCINVFVVPAAVK